MLIIQMMPPLIIQPPLVQLQLPTKHGTATPTAADVRRAVFCIVMGSEDCMDAFEKLLRLPLKVGMRLGVMWGMDISLVELEASSRVLKKPLG